MRGEKHRTNAVKRGKRSPDQAVATLGEPLGDEHPDLLEDKSRHRAYQKEDDHLVPTHPHVVSTIVADESLGLGNGSELGYGEPGRLAHLLPVALEAVVEVELGRSLTHIIGKLSVLCGTLYGFAPPEPCHESLYQHNDKPDNADEHKETYQ